MEALSGEMRLGENDDAEATKNAETPISPRRLIQCRNLPIDQGCDSYAIADNLEDGIPSELGNACYSKI